MSASRRFRCRKRVLYHKSSKKHKKNKANFVRFADRDAGGGGGFPNHVTRIVFLRLACRFDLSNFTVFQHPMLLKNDKFEIFAMGGEVLIAIYSILEHFHFTKK